MRRILGLLFLLWASSASATVTCTLPFNLQNGTNADATQVMANYNALVTCFTQAASAGVNTDITALTGITTPISPAQGGSSVYAGGTSTGSANAQVVSSPTPINFSLTAGKRITFIAGFTNTSAMTLNVNATGAIAVSRMTPVFGPQALAGGEIVVGNYVEAVYDGTRFQLYTNNSTPGIGPTTGVTGAATTDLGLVANHNVFIVGPTTISSFGASASIVYPVYRLSFSAGTTLIHNASLLLPGLANITTGTNDLAEALYLGSGNWLVTSYFRANGTAVVNPTPLSGAVGLTITNDPGTPSTKINVAVDQLTLVNPSGNVPIYFPTLSASINCTIVGANGLDTGALAASTWYNIFMISNGAATAGIASLSATAPTMPTGYVYLVRLGAVRTDGSANFLRTKQQGSHTVYTPVTASNTTGPIQMTSGSNAAWTAIATGTYVPPTATQIKGVLSSISMGNNTTSSVAPNSNYPTTSVGNSATTPWSITNSTGAANGLSANMVFEFNLESTNIYYASNAGSATTISAMGWTDKVNAN